MISFPVAATTEPPSRSQPRRPALAISGYPAASGRRSCSSSAQRSNSGGVLYEAHYGDRPAGDDLSSRQGQCADVREEIDRLNASFPTSIQDSRIARPSLSGQPAEIRGDGPAGGPASLSAEKARELATLLIEISKLEPQPRGLRFEGFLNELFAGFELAPATLSGSRGSRSMAVSGCTARPIWWRRNGMGRRSASPT